MDVSQLEPAVASGQRVLDTVVVGLGRVAHGFDQEPGRRTIWTHVGAYLANGSRLRIAGACDIDRAGRESFAARFPEIPVFESLDAMLAETEPEVASICTPPGSHRAVAERLMQSPNLKVLWCEKPLADSLGDAEALAAAAESRGVHVVVSHVRRWTPFWRRARALIADGAVGRLRCVRILMPNRMWSVGAHAVDLALFLGGPVTSVVPMAVPELDEDGEPAVAALLAFAGGGYGIVQVAGLKKALVVEAEVIGDGGRIALREDRGTIAIERFAPGAAYDGYEQLGEATVERAATLAETSPFEAVAREIAALCDGALASPTCGAGDALEGLRVLEQMRAASPLPRQGSGGHG
jgi:predicted dehydrogenase